MTTPDLHQLDALAAAVREGTFDAAARALHVTPSALSQRIKALENTTGRVLLVREKPVRPTEAGRAMLRLATQVRALVDDAAREAGGSEAPVPVLPLAVNADSLATWFLPALARVADPVAFDLHSEDQERTVDLLRDGTVMAAVTASSVAAPGCSVEPLGAMRYRAVCRPAFAEQWFAGGPTTAALHMAPMVVFNRVDDLQDRYLRRRTRGRADPPRHLVRGSEAFAQAVRLGLGWGMLPDLQAADDLRTGVLVEFDRRGALDVALHWQQWRVRSRSLDAVGDAVRAGARDDLRPGDVSTSVTRATVSDLVSVTESERSGGSDSAAVR